MTLPPLSTARATALTGAFDRLRVLVVGDLMVDRFIVGQVTRISPEAPVPVIRFESEHARLGGAANVAHNLVALGASATLVGLTGEDACAVRLRQLLGDARLSTEGLVADATRPTIEKVRLIAGRHQQVARIDYEDDREASETAEAALIARVAALGDRADVVLVSDYLKGTVTRRLMDALLALKQPTRPVLVDPKVPHLPLYRGVTLITPNNHEAETATHRRIQSDAEAQEAAAALRSQVGCDAVLITRGPHGLWLDDGTTRGAAPAMARDVSDVTGAGDTVVATLALALAAGGSLAEAAVLANHAAGVVVGKFGPATLSSTELLQAVSRASA